MTKFSYTNYLHEITKLAVELPCDFGEAWDRFRADVAAGEAHDYNTANLLPEFDFKAAGEQWNAMTEAEQQTARNVWYALTQENGVYKPEIVQALVKAYKAGKEKEE